MFLPLPRFVPGPQTASGRLQQGKRADWIVGIVTLTLVLIVAKVGSEAFVRFHPPDALTTVDLNPSHLPNYAARSALRMFIGLAASFLFTLVYGYVAAHNKRAERILLPLLDILQSVPVLGFLSITVTGFIALFRGSLLGLEAASVFAIFTGQAWNMTFSFYQSLKTVPPELDEMANLYGLSRWERFSRLELPSATIGLVWNAMMSFGGGWFFLAASESISVLNRQYTLPGIGSYVALAVQQQNLHALVWAILTMVALILLIDQFFWKPLVVLADRYKLELSAGEERRFWVVDLWRATHLIPMVRNLASPALKGIDRRLASWTTAPSRPQASRPPCGEWLFNTGVMLCTLLGALAIAKFVLLRITPGEIAHTTLLTTMTFARVLLLIAMSTLIFKGRVRAGAPASQGRVAGRGR